MSSQEIVFWISLFGLDFGVPLMLPEGLRFRVGVMATALSAAGMVWSLGYHPVPPSHLGYGALIVSVVVAGVSSLVVRYLREKELPHAIYEAAESVNGYVFQIESQEKAEHRNVTLLPLNKLRWNAIVAKYIRNHGRNIVRSGKRNCRPSI